MAYYKITYSCGHEGLRELHGRQSDKQRTIEWLESEGLCPKCYRKIKERELLNRYQEIEMRYYDYMNGEYSWCKTKTDSYNPATKTIVVFVPKKIKKQGEEQE